MLNRITLIIQDKLGFIVDLYIILKSRLSKINIIPLHYRHKDFLHRNFFCKPTAGLNVLIYRY